MPFISRQGQRETLQSIVPIIDTPAPSFGEVFSASLGHVFDENLSISGVMNREAWGERKRLIKEQVKVDNIKWGDYTDQDGHFDWNAAAVELDDPAIKTDEVLTQERNAMLKVRRDYANDVISRGSGMAQFLGAANAYVLDPVSILTMPLAAPVTAAKSLSIVGRALLTGRNAAAIEVATELAIQPFVYNNKIDIESPYSAGDAIENIAMAAIGGGALGGITGGISGYLKSVRKAAEALPQTDELMQAVENIARMEEVVSHAPTVDLAKAKAVEAEYIAEIRGELTAASGERLSRGEEKALTSEISNLQHRLEAIEVIAEPLRGGKGIPARKAKSKAAKEGEEVARIERESISELLNIAQGKLKKSAEAKAAQADLDRLRQGVIPQQHQKTLNQIKNEQLVENEMVFLRDLEAQREISGAPSRTPEQYAEPELPPAPKAQTTARESDVLSAIGITEDYNKAMDDFSRLDNPIIVNEAGELVDATSAMKAMDDELGGIESVLVCSRG